MLIRSSLGVYILQIVWQPWISDLILYTIFQIKLIDSKCHCFCYFLYQTALIAVLYIERDCVIDESKKAFLLLLQWSWYSKIRGRSLLGLCSTKKINGIWSKTFHFGYSIFVTDFMGLLLHPVYVFWCISVYFNRHCILVRFQYIDYSAHVISTTRISYDHPKQLHV